MALLGRRLIRNPDGGYEETSDWVHLTAEARRQGVYIPGTTGVGKTTLLKSLIYQDMVAGEGLCFIDPHGDAVNELLEIVPQNRKEDVILFAPGDDDQLAHPLGLNLLACDRSDPRQVRRVTSVKIGRKIPKMIGIRIPSSSVLRWAKAPYGWRQAQPQGECGACL